MKIVQKINHPLLKREQITFEIEHAGSKTPKSDEILQKIAEATKASKELIKIKNIVPGYGVTKAKVIANIYKDENAFKHIEIIKKKAKKKEDGKKEASKE
ncbi:hypothetical protein HYT57_03545 [Candidatus Woesearchaeota archaeon]|nr:hypothetical protein [Candidatus Woesearchaeota archaeon]